MWHDYLWLVGGWNPVVGGQNDTWFTKDGLIWEKLNTNPQWIGREDHAGVVFRDTIWTTGGMNANEIWEGDVWHLKVQNKISK